MDNQKPVLAVLRRNLFSFLIKSLTDVLSCSIPDNFTAAK